jgi:hypothetical protein
MRVISDLDKLDYYHGPFYTTESAERCIFEMEKCGEQREVYEALEIVICDSLFYITS